jgi:hypothetical protein
MQLKGNLNMNNLKQVLELILHVADEQKSPKEAMQQLKYEI